MKRTVIAVFVITVLLLLGSITGNVLLLAHENSDSKITKSIDKNEFQAVFLNTGQVYFGKLSIIDSNDYKIVDVSYLNNPKSLTTLTKLVNSVQKPQDAMYIPKGNITFWENLKNANQFNGEL